MGVDFRTKMIFLRKLQSLARAAKPAFVTAWYIFWEATRFFFLTLYDLECVPKVLEGPFLPTVPSGY